MDTNNVGGRAVSAVISGLVAFVIAAIVLWLVSVVLPGVSIDSVWATVVGVLVGLATFFSGRTRV